MNRSVNRSVLGCQVRDALHAELGGDAARVEATVERVWRGVKTAITGSGLARARRERHRLTWRVVGVVAACLAVLITAGAFYLRATGLPDQAAGPAAYPPGAPLATEDDYLLASRHVDKAGLHGGMSLPAPLPFDAGFSIDADPIPACAGQGVTLQSTGGWLGRQVWLYAAPASEQYIIEYLRKLPLDAMPIGTADINSAGTWRFSWPVPDTITLNGTKGGGDTVVDLRDRSVLYLVAANDSGYLAAVGLEIGPERTLDIAPQPVTPGEILTISGSGYPAGIRVRLDILHESPEGGTDLQANLGWVVTDASGTFEFSQELPEALNQPYADNTGVMRDHWLELGEGGTYRILAVEWPDDGPGAVLQKTLIVGRS